MVIRYTGSVIVDVKSRNKARASAGARWFVSVYDVIFEDNRTPYIESDMPSDARSVSIRNQMFKQAQESFKRDVAHGHICPHVIMPVEPDGRIRYS